MDTSINKEEESFISLLKKLLLKYEQQGTRDVRDGHSRVSLFGAQLHFDLNKSFPLFTHRQFFVRGIFEELMFFLRGQTDNKILEDKKVYIWSPWNGILDLKKPTELGKIYGHMWRNFGQISLTNGDILHQGFDQIEWIVNEIKTNPASSRLIVSGWDPAVSTQTPKEAVLPTCHTLFQFFVDDGKLSCQLYQRSADISLAGGFNVASYALLTHMVAQQCGLDVGTFVWTLGDYHLYSNQIEDVRKMVEQPLHVFPQLHLEKAKDIYSYEWSDITINNYQHSGKMENLKVAV